MYAVHVTGVLLVIALMMTNHYETARTSVAYERRAAERKADFEVLQQYVH